MATTIPWVFYVLEVFFNFLKFDGIHVKKKKTGANSQHALIDMLTVDVALSWPCMAKSSRSFKLCFVED